MISSQYGIRAQEGQTGAEMSQTCVQQLEKYLAPWSERLDAYVDRRIVGNLSATVAGIVQTRSELTLTELGSAITGPEHAEVGRQRLERVLLHQKWKAEMLEQVWWDQAEGFRHQVQQRAETPLCIWDSSVLEKAESQKLEGLGKVRSSKARRLARSRAGVFNRPGAPIMVRGFEWESLLLAGKTGVPQVVAMRWWSREQQQVGSRERLHEELLGQATRLWGRQVRHVFDRGFGHGPWLARLAHAGVRFVVRWMKGRKLIDAAGQERKAWEIARGKRAWGEAKLVWDTHCHVYRSTRVLALPVRHPDYEGPVWLVVVRQGQGREPWYLLTNEPVETEQDAWEMAISYGRRWQIEESYRFQKCELQIESVRVQGWEPRRKLLLLVSLAYGFLLSLLGPAHFPLRQRVLEQFCQRADWRRLSAKAPLYRLRWALSRLWGRYPPQLRCCLPYRPPTRPTWPACSLPWWTTLWHQLGYVF